MRQCVAYAKLITSTNIIVGAQMERFKMGGWHGVSGRLGGSSSWYIEVQIGCEVSIRFAPNFHELCTPMHNI